jgi:hypothetical protein
MSEHALLDWQEWVLALVTGLVSAVAYERINALRRAEHWKQVRESLLRTTWVEATWPYVVMHQLWGWQHKVSEFVYGGYIRELEDLKRLAGPVHDEIPTARLTTPQRDFLQRLPQLIPIARDLMLFVDDLLRYTEIWTEHDRLLLLEARRAFQAVARWNPPTPVPPEQVSRELFRGVDYSLDAITQLDAFAKWASRQLPQSDRQIPHSQIADL